MVGIHWRFDGQEGLLLGEMVGVRILQQVRRQTHVDEKPWSVFLFSRSGGRSEHSKIIHTYCWKSSSETTALDVEEALQPTLLR